MRRADEIIRERDAFVEEHQGRILEQGLERIERLVENAKTQLEARTLQLLFERNFHDPKSRITVPEEVHPANDRLPELALFFIFSSADFKAWLADQLRRVAPQLCSKLTLQQYERKLAAFQAELDEIDRHGKEQELKSRREEIERELQALDSK
jgi:hypothetical protein